ncbi:MAG: head-tail adaptor protein [Rhodobacteraceae bacterium]|nr:head-tail adaptor protein [Paracoccaceae bacterium]
MSVPRLNRPLILEALDRVADGAGGYVENWLALGTLWAQVDARTGRARAEVGQTLGVTSLRIVVRAAPAGSPARPEPGQRFRDGARVYLIEAVAERDATGAYLTCFAEEEVGS